MTGNNFDQEKADAFGSKMLDVLNAGALSLMISIGHRTGLFDTMSHLGSANCKTIAIEAGLQERYVSEWMGAMLTGGIVRYEEQKDAYYLPAEHAASLTRSASPENIAAFSQYIPVLGRIEDQIVECFNKGGGVPYSQYDRFHEVMAEDSGQTVVAALLEHILGLVPSLTDRLTEGIDVLDVGCGSGRAVNLMAESFAASRFTGLDFSEEAVTAGRTEAENRRLSNVSFEVEDVSQLQASAAYDLITAFDAIHDQAQPAKVLKNIAESLRPDGIFLMQDINASSVMHKNIDHPIGPFLYTISCMHCMTVSLAQGGPGLGAMWGREKAEQMLRQAGFTEVRIEQLPHDFQNSYYIATKNHS